MKVIVVGGVAAGASAAARLRRLDEKAEIIIFEQGEHVSFSNCGLPYHLGGTIPDADDLVLMTPRAFKARHNIEVRVNSRVTAIDRKAKTVTVQPKEGPAYTESYDKLILAPGAAPIVPGSIPGVRSPHVFTLRNVTDVKAIKAYIDEQGVTRAAVVGGGFIGVEVAENLACAGLLVTLVEGADQVLAPFDYDMAQILHKELMDNGVQVELNSLLTAVHPDRITVTRDGEAFDLPAQMVVLAIGVSPETALAKDAGLAIGETRGIKVDANWRTEDEDVYAVGDAVESFDRLARRTPGASSARPACGCSTRTPPPPAFPKKRPIRRASPAGRCCSIPPIKSASCPTRLGWPSSWCSRHPPAASWAPRPSAGAMRCAASTSSPPSSP